MNAPSSELALPKFYSSLSSSPVSNLTDAPPLSLFSIFKMLEKPVSQLGDSLGGAAEEDSGARQLRFEGFDAFSPGELDPEVAPAASAAPPVGARYKTLSPARLLIAARSPCLTIPPGLSPTTLLESPVLLTNIKAEPSPTTGTFSMPLLVNDGVGSKRFSPMRSFSNDIVNEEVKKAHDGLLEHQPETLLQFRCQHQSAAIETSCLVNPENAVVSANDMTLSVMTAKPEIEISSTPVCEPVPNGSQLGKGTKNGIQVSGTNQKENEHLLMVEKSSKDGYNWRKYGQKHVKGSEFPRSYYKCTHANCQMKKMLERSHDGQITEIVYKGQHDHPKPQPNCRLGVGAVLCSQGGERSDGFSSLINGEAKSLNAHDQTSQPDLEGTPDLSPVSANDGDIDGSGAGPSENVDNTVDEDPETKRRRKDGSGLDFSASGKTNQSRVVVQTLSDVDILDDGYRWRKYGQKVVKGNPNPRSYYKCTNAGCSVRKHVERASHDPKAVITTYEGKHNHDVPASKTSSHDISTTMAVNGCNILNNHTSVAMSGMLATYDSIRTISHQHEQMEESDTISLDLGVGLSPRYDNRIGEKHLMPGMEQIQSRQLQVTHSGCSNLMTQPPSGSPYYSNSNRGTDSFRPREDTQGFSFKTIPLSHSSYQAAMGRLLMGP